MKKFIVFLFFLLMTFGFVFSQKSDEIISKGGKQFYVHVVQPGNSLYGLYRLYNVSVDEIKNVNPVKKIIFGNPPMVEASSKS